MEMGKQCQCPQAAAVPGTKLDGSSLALHPRKDIVVTGSNDHLWKMWALPDGNILMTGEGHTDWLSGCCFRPSGTQLVTSSGDTTVRIWDLSRRGCILTLQGHARAVHDCSWHSQGDFVASASMDSTSKIWDVNSERCRYTLRGHKDSVNSIEFLPFSSTVLTSSADKTLSLWDSRTVNNPVIPIAAIVGKNRSWVSVFTHSMVTCIPATMLHSTPSIYMEKILDLDHGLFGQIVQPSGYTWPKKSEKGDTIASCDSSGVMKLWDMRKLVATLSIDAGPHPANQVAFDPSAECWVKRSSEFLQSFMDLVNLNSSVSRLSGVKQKACQKWINTAFIIHILEYKKGIFEIRYSADLGFVCAFYVLNVREGMAMAFSAQDWIGQGTCRGAVIRICVTVEMRCVSISKQESLASL
ncbi:sperm associated antigen 16 [Pitangus sulphuratus]|nr:sperm associated antigen 16 [Pitangus sulphuratus]